MNRRPFTSLTPDIVMDAVESVGYPPDARILALNSYENRVFQIGIADQEPIIGKFYRPNRWTDAQILEEHDYTLDLAENDVSVVAPWRLHGKETLGHYQGFRFSLYPRRGGRAPNLDNEDNLEILGRHIGKIHALGALSNFIHRPEINVQHYGWAARSFLLRENFIPTELIPAYETVTEQLLPILEQMFDNTRLVEKIRLHGDCHIGNILWRDNLPHFVDFDDARTGVPIQDLWMMLSGSHAEQRLQLSAIVRGYDVFNRFDHRQIQLIEPLRTLRLMYHAYWLASRWEDPAFPQAFPFFNEQRYWSQHILELREQWALLSEPAIQIDA